MQNAETVKNDSVTLDGLQMKLKDHMMLQLGYDEQEAQQQADKYAEMFKLAFA